MAVLPFNLNDPHISKLLC